jgi:hypothetical protein
MERSFNINDNNGHGTHVAGIIADLTPANVDFLVLKIADSEGSSSSLVMNLAVNYAISEKVDVMNISYGFLSKSANRFTFLDKAINRAYKEGIPVVTAAGNLAADVTGRDVKNCYPACNSQTIAVSALDRDLKLAYYSYYGSEIDFTAPGTQIVAAGLADVAVDFLNSIQRPETGSWGKYDGYEAVNGILKISGVYQQAKRAIPNALNTAMTAMDCLNLDVECEAVVWQYNAWYSIRNITDNLRRFGGEVGKRQAAEIVAECLRRAPEAIRSSAKKCLPFLCEDGAYSYTPGFSSSTSQAARVSLGLKEGDVNATVINCTGIIHNSLKALDLEESFVPLFGRSGYEKFLEGVESVRNK